MVRPCVDGTDSHHSVKNTFWPIVPHHKLYLGLSKRRREIGGQSTLFHPIFMPPKISNLLQKGVQMKFMFYFLSFVANWWQLYLAGFWWFYDCTLCWVVTLSMRKKPMPWIRTNTDIDEQTPTLSIRHPQPGSDTHPRHPHPGSNTHTEVRCRDYGLGHPNGR